MLKKAHKKEGGYPQLFLAGTAPYIYPGFEQVAQMSSTGSPKAQGARRSALAALRPARARNLPGCRP